MQEVCQILLALDCLCRSETLDEYGGIAYVLLPIQ